ncbi:phage integrase family protein [Variovorax sp. M-6]|uniref:phage integrase family protein n=1 Tax=Variovorax sp. M-6 TaxID=3233041 RepID=UPI003F9A63C2
MRTPIPRKLHGGHFAFMRALAQGLDERASWDRYLRLEGEHTDLRKVRRTIAWIRDEFAAAARRECRPGTARLILLDPERFAEAPALPSLEEFAAAQGMEDFSEAEQVEAYEEAYPSGRGGQGGGSGQPSRRGRVIERQLEALRWLQDLVAQDPRPTDSVAAWLNPALAARLERAGLPTLVELVERINGIGARWWAQVPGVGELKAARILDWLQANEAVLGLRVGRHVAQPRAQLTPTTLAAVVSAATAIRPYEKFVVPAELDGRAGRHRAPQEQCLLRAANDHAAIAAWLASKRRDDAAVELTSTQRSYRKEAERLLLWSILERKKALSSLSAADAADYRSFLAAPSPAWCGPRHHQRWSPMWRPLEGPLTPVALRQSLIILRSLFAFLVDQRYLTLNPFSEVVLPSNAQLPLGSSRTLSFSQWEHLDALLQAYIDTEPKRRLRRGMRWLYATGLRLTEITTVKCEDLRRVEDKSTEGLATEEWLLQVTGRAGRIRQVRVPAELVAELGDELERHGLERQVGAMSNRGIHVMARFDAELNRPEPWSASGLYQAIKAFLAFAATRLDGVEAQHLKRASTHWLRHSHGSHALQGREGRTPVPIKVVQNNLGHASIGTTSLYLSIERGEAEKTVQGLRRKAV